MCFGASRGGLCKQHYLKEKLEKVGWVTGRLAGAAVGMNALSQGELARLQKEIIELCPWLGVPPPVRPLPCISPGVCAVMCELGGS